MSGSVSQLRVVSFITLLGLTASAALGQATPPAQGHVVGPPPVIINFVVGIDTNTVNQLLQIVNRQMNAGIRRITILIASPGGDVAAGFAAYNILRNMPNLELTTFNVGNVDSAAMLLFSAGRHRFSLPGPGPRFLIHGVSYGPPAGSQLNSQSMDNQLQQINSLDSMLVDALSTVAPSRLGEIQNAVRSQTILSPEQAMEWGIVQEIRRDYMEPGAVMIAVDRPGIAPERNPSTATTGFTSISIPAIAVSDR